MFETIAYTCLEVTAQSSTAKTACRSSSAKFRNVKISSRACVRGCHFFRNRNRKIPNRAALHVAYHLLLLCVVTTIRVLCCVTNAIRNVAIHRRSASEGLLLLAEYRLVSPPLRLSLRTYHGVVMKNHVPQLVWFGSVGIGGSFHDERDMVEGRATFHFFSSQFLHPANRSFD